MVTAGRADVVAAARADAGRWSIAAPGRLRWPQGWPLAVSGRYRWPVDGPARPVRRFDPPPQPWLAGHRGVDLAAPPGAVIRSAGPGTVLFAGLVAGRPVVTVGHAGGLRTTHEPVRPAVRPGQPVAAGAPLGELLPGHPGCPTTACLHWGLRRGAEYLDPLALLGLGPVRLLPVEGQRWASSAGSRTASRS
ncbi:murein hydrolase activator EnvC family protein [Micromonospora sp. CPCC 205539]|uniref:murein hydrolase activator EnvC family protein n=1 Tax=Micromonospora sp. CPCC 205539 TaxID=3122408 RepID=UPI003FA578A6